MESTIAMPPPMQTLRFALCRLLCACCSFTRASTRSAPMSVECAAAAASGSEEEEAVAVADVEVPAAAAVAVGAARGPPSRAVVSWAWPCSSSSSSTARPLALSWSSMSLLNSEAMQSRQNGFPTRRLIRTGLTNGAFTTSIARTCHVRADFSLAPHFACPYQIIADAFIPSLPICYITMSQLSACHHRAAIGRASSTQLRRPSLRGAPTIGILARRIVCRAEPEANAEVKDAEASHAPALEELAS